MRRTELRRTCCMIPVEELLNTSRLLCKTELHSKKRALETLAGLLAAELDIEEVSEMDLLDALTARERLGTTGLGHGVSLPHGRIKGLEAPVGALITLKDGVDYDAPDNEPVDILFGLVVPENHDDDHLKILASLATLFANENTRKAIRGASDSSRLYELVAAQMAPDQQTGDRAPQDQSTENQTDGRTTIENTQDPTLPVRQQR